MKKEKLLGLGFLIVVISLVGIQGYIFFSQGSDYDGWASDVYVDQDIAYFTDSEKGLIIMDVSNPSKPLELGRFSEVLEHYGDEEVYVHNSMAYFINEDRLKIINVIDPTAPFNVSELGYNRIGRMFVDFPYIYLTQSSETLIIDVSNHSSPTQIGQIDSGGSDIYVRNNLAYIAGSNGLIIFDVSNSTNSTMLSQLDFDKSYYRCVVDENTAYLMGWPGDIDIIDVSNSSNPFKLGQYEYKAGVSVEGICIHDDTLYTANLDDGIELLDISDPSKPSKIGQFHMLSASEIFIDFPFAYVACENNGFKIVNISNPSIWRDSIFVINFIITIIGIGVAVSFILLKLKIKSKEG